jgi:hypothetical protein
MAALSKTVFVFCLIHIGNDVRCGSNSEVDLADADFRFTPESRLKSDITPCPKSANNGLSHCNKVEVTRARSRHGSPTPMG